MLFVFVFAEAVRGSKRWIDLGPFQFQPSEFGKLFFVLAIAGFLVERGRRVGELGTVADARSVSASCRWGSSSSSPTSALRSSTAPR